MADFQEPTNHALIAFDEGHPLHGLELRVNANAPVGVIFDFERIGDESNPVKVSELLRRFGDQVLVDWNYARNGERVPPTGEGMMSCSMQTMREIVREAMQALASPSIPLEQPSRSGLRSVGPSAGTAA